MTIKENVEQMLNALANNDKESADDMFQNIMAQKVAERLDTYKVDVANQYFNGFKEATDDVVEEETEQKEE